MKYPRLKGTTMTTTPIRAPRQHEPTKVTLLPLHLSITQEWESGTSRNIHLLHNGDLNTIHRRGSKDVGEPVTPGEEGSVVVLLGVDDDHDEVQYVGRGIGAEEVMAQAIEALEACRAALTRVEGV